MPSKSKLATILLITALISSNLIWAGVFYWKFAYQNSNEVIAQSQQKLNAIDVELPSIKYDYYKIQNPETATKIAKDMEKVNRITKTVSQDIAAINLAGTKESTTKNIDEFQSLTKSFEQNKKEVDCIIKVYEESSGGNNLYSYQYQGLSDSSSVLESMINDATKCGAVITEPQKTQMIESYKNMVEQSKILNSKQSSFNFQKGDYSEQQMQESQKLSEEYSKYTSKFADAIVTPIRQKYQPIVDYTEYLKTVSF
jgi:hypothetical protein